MYHTLFEHFLGKTPGKYITLTKVVDSEGNWPRIGKLFLRNLCRLIPFDAVSYLISKRGWHDKISGTYVVQLRETSQ
ncbi:MAG: RDD family protein [Flavobacteriales bacterium]|nr:RDD family protein [Flavobacteriales bacterium]